VSGSLAWRGVEGFRRFLEDMGERPEGTTLGRIGDEGDYVPGNVKWMTHEEQLAILAQSASERRRPYEPRAQPRRPLPSSPRLTPSRRPYRALAGVEIAKHQCGLS
jgi:hypothetical protein